MTPEQWLIATAGSWCLAYAVTKTHGMFGMFERLREFKGGRWHGRSKPIARVTYDPNAPPTEGVPPNSRIVGYDDVHDGLFDCIICLIFWIALVIVWLLTGRVLPLEALAVAGVALFLHSYTGWRINM